MIQTKESDVTKTVREAVVKAAEKGEDMAVSTKEISRNVMKNAISKIEPTKENIEETVRDIVKGVAAGANEAGLEVKELTGKAVEGAVPPKLRSLLEMPQMFP